MKSRYLMVALAIVLLSSFAPVFAFDDASAETTDEITVTVPEAGASGVLTVEMHNGEKYVTKVYLMNKTGCNFSVTPITVKDAILTITGSSDKDVLGPGEVATIVMTVEADKYCDDLEPCPYLPTIRLMCLENGSVQTKTIDFMISVNSSFATEDEYNKFFGLIPNPMTGILGSPLITALVTFVGTLVIAWILSELFSIVFIRLGMRDSNEEERKNLKSNVVRMISLLAVVLGVRISIPVMGVDVTVMTLISPIIAVISICIISWLIWKVYSIVMKGILKGIEKTSKTDGLDMSLLPLFKMIGKIVIAISAVAAILAQFGVNLEGILISAGVVSLGITMGAQNILSQFFSGLVLLATRPFKKGDFLNIGGTVYIVRKVKLMYTEFDNWDKDQVVTFPNNAVTGATIVNYSRGVEARLNVPVPVAYGTDLALARKLMIQAATEHPKVVINDNRAAPNIRCTQLQDSGIELTIRCFVTDFDSTGGIAGEIRERVLQLFAENGVEVPYNRLEVDILNQRMDDPDEED